MRSEYHVRVFIVKGMEEKTVICPKCSLIMVQFKTNNGNYYKCTKCGEIKMHP